MIENISSDGAGLSALGSSTEGFVYREGHQKLQGEVPLVQSSAARNSEVRRKTAPIFRRFAKTGLDRYPDMTATEWSISGGIDITVANIITLSTEKNELSALMFLGGAIKDAIDGEWAREKALREEKQTTNKGANTDASVDRWKDILTLATLSEKARRKDNNFAANMYLIAAMTSTMPSLLRAQAESKGDFVPENGIGASLARTILEVLGVAAQDNKTASSTLSFLLVAGIVKTTYQRSDVVLKGKCSKYRVEPKPEDPPLTAEQEAEKLQKVMEAAKERRLVLMPFAIAGVQAGRMALKRQAKLRANNR